MNDFMKDETDPDRLFEGLRVIQGLKKMQEKRRCASQRLLRNAVRAVGRQLIELQRRCFDRGLIRTAGKLNAAAQELGWEAEALLTGKPYAPD
jgi:hypothetical protein